MPVSQYQPSLGVKSDFETLLQRFTATDTVRYEKFAEVWREMKMSMYCAGRETSRESREFTEECFRIATQFLLPPSSFQVRAGALYLLYGLFNFQLCCPKAKIRLTVEQWVQVTEFLAQAHQQQHLDISYILHKLRVDKAFMFVAAPTEMYPFQNVNKDNAVPETFKDESSLLEEVFSSQTLNQIAAVHDQYHKMKISLNGPDAEKPELSLDVMHEDLLKVVYRTLSNHKERLLAVSQARRKPVKLEGAAGIDDNSPDQTDHYLDSQYQEMSTKGRLKKKAFENFSPGRKSRRKSVPTETVKSPRKTAGRSAAPKLYSSDDVEGREMVTKVEGTEVISMPELDEAVASTSSDPGAEATGSEERTDTPHRKGKRKATAPSAGGKKRGRPRSVKTVEASDSLTTDSELIHVETQEIKQEDTAQDKLQQKLLQRRKASRKKKK